MFGWLRGLIGLILALAIILPSAGLMFVWWDGSQLLAQKPAQAWMAPKPAGGAMPLTPLEAVAANAVFGKTWNITGTPCRTFARFWINYTGKPDKNGLAVSQVVARDIATRLSPGLALRAQLQQLAMACQLEQQFDDTALLRIWLRRAYYGKNLTGSEAAAEALFHKTPGLLNPDEAAMLVALIYWPDGWDHQADWDKRAKLITSRTR
jgi:Transglycosylase